MTTQLLGTDVQRTQTAPSQRHAPATAAPQTSSNRPAEVVRNPRAAEQARQAFITKHMSLVRAIARSMCSRFPAHVELDDVMSHGMLGLIHAADRYEAARGVPFEQFARTRIRGAIVDGLRAEDWIPTGARARARRLAEESEDMVAQNGRVDNDVLAARLDLNREDVVNYKARNRLPSLLSFDAPLSDDSEDTLESTLGADTDVLERITAEDNSVLLRDAMNRLPDRERTAVEMQILKGATLEDVGDVLGVTVSRAYQLRNRGLERMRYFLQASELAAV